MTPADHSPDLPAAPLTVACLCAAWCRTCDAYRGVFEAALGPLAASGVEPRWVDVEDEADALGALDVENFPTLLIARGEALLFFGTVTPHASTLTRLVQAALDGDTNLGGERAEAAAHDLARHWSRARRAGG